MIAIMVGEEEREKEAAWQGSSAAPLLASGPL